ncbi:MAG: hypothetical protein MUC83_05835, partial [Pirellula sp.]|nr:hypothetical protein [Pirellula sp.]
TLRRCDWQMEWWSGPVGESYRILDKMYYSDFAAIMNLFRVGSIPDGYRIYVLQETPPFPYPWIGVFWITGFMVFQAIVLYIILRPESYAWDLSRTLTAFVFQLVMFVFFAFFSMHSPPYYAWFLLWMIICLATLLILSVLARVIGVVRRPP